MAKKRLSDLTAVTTYASDSVFHVATSAGVDNKITAANSLDKKADKITSGTENNIVTIDDDENIKDSGVAINEITPVGTIIMYGASGTPTNYLYCDGSVVSRTTYAALFAVIDDTYGAGDGVNTFALPNYQAVVPKGVGSQTINRAKTGPTLGTAEEDQAQGHTHSGGVSGIAVGTGAGTAAALTFTGASQTFANHIGNFALAEKTGDGTPRTGTTTRDNSLGTRFYIKYA